MDGDLTTRAPGPEVDLTTRAPGPEVDLATGDVVFVVTDEPGITPRHVWFHLRDFGADPRFHREADHWVARIPRPPVDRMEYLLVLGLPEGGEAMVTDPANPRRVRTVFGDHSVVEFPGYDPPWWIAVAEATEAQSRRDAQAVTAATRRARGGRATPLRRAASIPARARGLVRVAAPAVPRSDPLPVTSSAEGVASVGIRPTVIGGDDRALRSPKARAHPAGVLIADPAPKPETIVDADAEVSVTGQLFVPADSGPEEALPLLVVHDGPEYAELAQLLRYVATLSRIESELRCRVLLLQPVDRDRSYSASPAYARALVTRMLPRVFDTVATRELPVAMGASLGGLAALHAAMSHPGSFAGIFSQSGSFFRPRTDGMESGYRFYGRIVRFVDDIDADPGRLAGLRVVMTCGTGEENLANNRDLARRLARMGVPSALAENPDGHNYTGWRDCLDPSLRNLLRAVWGRAGNARP